MTVLVVSEHVNKWTKEKIGIKTIYKLRKNATGLLDLQHPEPYTGHCWRRNAAMQVASAGASTMVNKKKIWTENKNKAMKYSACLK